MATSPNAPQNNPRSEMVASLRDQLERMTNQFAMVMPAETVDRFKRIFVTTLNENPDLLKCTPRSLLQCAMRAAQDGLDLDGREAAIVPFRDGPEILGQYVPMVLGIRKKVRQTGLISDWTVHVVYEGDEFDIAFGDRPYIHHKPAMKGGRTRPVMGAYSIATFKDGARSYEFMNVDEIEDVRTKSKARTGPWTDKIFYPEMCKKTVARLHAKQLPQSSDLVSLFAREDAESEVALPPPVPTPRLHSVTAALDEFGAGFDRDNRNSLSPPNQRNSEAGEDAGASPPDPAPRDPSPHDGEERPEMTAYRRGKEQKAAGHTAKAIPPEYRASDRTREALAWQAGFAGNPLPSWESDDGRSAS